MAVSLLCDVGDVGGLKKPCIMPRIMTQLRRAQPPPQSPRQPYGNVHHPPTTTSLLFLNDDVV
jgi:hypothetical protein